jgi:hypothetical protein
MKHLGGSGDPPYRNGGAAGSSALKAASPVYPSESVFIGDYDLSKAWKTLDAEERGAESL